jgi:prepilin-type N-terminal cleavage/methylation domain-containing protein
LKTKEGFTIIEVLVSVVLISIVVLAILEIQQRNRAFAVYILEQNKAEFGNTLFLGAEAQKYHKENKDAYTLLAKQFKIDDFESRDILKQIKRDIFISDPIQLTDDTLPVQINEVLLKGDYSARYMRIQSR